MRGYIEIVMVLLVGSTSFAQVAEHGEMTPEQRSRLLTSFAERELTLEVVRIGNLIQLDDAERERLRKVGKPIAKRIGTARAKNPKLPTFILRNFPGAELSDAIAKELANTRGAKVGRQYADDVRRRIDFFDRAYGDMLLVMLDQQVGLEEEQVAKARKEIKALPLFRYTHPHIHSYDWAWGITPPDEFVKHRFKCLSGSQTKLWVKRAELLKPLLSDPMLGVSLQSAAVIEERSRAAMELKAEILTEQLSLTRAQAAKLKLLAKRVTKDLADRVPEAYKVRETSMVKPNGEGWAMSLPQRIPIFELIHLTDLFDLIECQTDWRRWVRSVLNDRQRAIYDARHKQRVAHNHDAYWRCWVVCYSLRLGLTADQEKALFDLLSQSIKPDPTATRVSHTSYYQPGAIRRDAYVKAIGEEHTADLDRRELAGLRAALAEKKATRD